MPVKEGTSFVLYMNLQEYNISNNSRTFSPKQDRKRNEKTQNEEKPVPSASQSSYKCTGKVLQLSKYVGRGAFLKNLL